MITLNALHKQARLGPPYDPTWMEALKQDPRVGAHTIYQTCLQRERKVAEEAERLERMCRYEKTAQAEGFRRVAGVDEAGRGPLAGPIVAAAVVLGKLIPGLDDSKRLTAEQRTQLFAALHKAGETGSPNTIAVAIIDAAAIDTMGIQVANYSSMFQAASRLDPLPDFLLVDGFSIPGCRFPHQAIVKGDMLSASIAAASIVAKVVRDRIMVELDRQYPQYGFARHKGYATQEHYEAIRRYGPSPVHRVSFLTKLDRSQTELYPEEPEPCHHV